MPTIRKLNPDEVQGMQSGKLSTRQQTSREYDALLAEFEPGEWGEVALDESDNKLTVRNRLQSAAKRRGLILTFKRTPAPVIRFEVALPDTLAVADS